MALPSVQPNVVMIPSRRNERGFPPESLSQLEAEHAAVEGQGTVQISYLEMHMPDPNPGINRIGSHLLSGLLTGLLCQGSQASRLTGWHCYLGLVEPEAVRFAKANSYHVATHKCWVIPFRPKSSTLRGWL